MPPLPDYSSNYGAGNGRRDGAAGRGALASGGYQVSCRWMCGRPFLLFPIDEVQRDNKNDEGDSDQEPPVVFTQEVDTRAVNLNDGNVSVVNLDYRDGKKCCAGDNSGTEEVGFNFEFHLTEDPPAVGVVPR